MRKIDRKALPKNAKRRFRREKANCLRPISPTPRRATLKGGQGDLETSRYLQRVAKKEGKKSEIAPEE